LADRQQRIELLAEYCHGCLSSFDGNISGKEKISEEIK